MHGEPPTPESYAKRWPLYCRSCDGWGGSVFYETHGLPGPGEPIGEPCPGCTDHPDTPHCARCFFPYQLTADGDLPDDMKCLACGWDHDDGIPELDYPPPSASAAPGILPGQEAPPLNPREFREALAKLPHADYVTYRRVIVGLNAQVVSLQGRLRALELREKRQ